MAPQSSVAAALAQKLRRLRTNYVAVAEDIAARAPRLPAEAVVRVLARYERSRDVRGAFLRIKTRMLQAQSTEKAAAARAKQDAALAVTRKRTAARARELASISDGFEALHTNYRRGRRARWAAVVLDTRRAFAFFETMRERLERKRLHRRATGVATLLRVRSCFRTLRAHARGEKVVNEISRLANRRSARRALGLLQNLRLRGMEICIAIIRADRVAKACAARRGLRGLREIARFERTKRQAAHHGGAATKRRGLTQFALSATARETSRCTRHRAGVFCRRGRLRAAFRHLFSLAAAGSARRARRRRAAGQAATAAKGRGLEALKALVDRAQTQSACDALADAAAAVGRKSRGLATLSEEVARAGRRRRRETAACIGERAVALRALARWQARVDTITHLQRLMRKALRSKGPARPKLRTALDAWWTLRRDGAIGRARLELAEIWRNRRVGRAALAALIASMRDRGRQRRAHCTVDEFHKRNALKRLARLCVYRKRDRAAYAAALARRQLVAFPRLQARVAETSARELKRVARHRLRRGVALLCGRVRAMRLRKARKRLAQLHHRSFTGWPALLRLQESSAHRRRARVARRAQHYEALDVTSARALRRWRFLAASRRSTREKNAPLVDGALVALALRRARRFLTEWRSHVTHARATRHAELTRLVDKFRAWRTLTERRAAARLPPPPSPPRPPVLQRLADDAPVAAPVSLSPQPTYVDLVHLKHHGAGPHSAF